MELTDKAEGRAKRMYARGDFAELGRRRLFEPKAAGDLFFEHMLAVADCVRPPCEAGQEVEPTTLAVAAAPRVAASAEQRLPEDQAGESFGAVVSGGVPAAEPGMWDHPPDNAFEDFGDVDDCYKR